MQGKCKRTISVLERINQKNRKIITKKYLLIQYSNGVDIMEFNNQDDLMNYFNINIQQCEDFTEAETYGTLLIHAKVHEIEIVEIDIDINDDDFSKTNVDIKTSKQLINK